MQQLKRQEQQRGELQEEPLVSCRHLHVYALLMSRTLACVDSVQPTMAVTCNTYSSSAVPVFFTPNDCVTVLITYTCINT